MSEDSSCTVALNSVTLQQICIGISLLPPNGQGSQPTPSSVNSAADQHLRVGEVAYEQPGDREMIIGSRAVAINLLDKK